MNTKKTVLNQHRGLTSSERRQASEMESALREAARRQQEDLHGKLVDDAINAIRRLLQADYLQFGDPLDERVGRVAALRQCESAARQEPYDSEAIERTVWKHVKDLMQSKP